MTIPTFNSERTKPERHWLLEGDAEPAATSRFLFLNTRSLQLLLGRRADPESSLPTTLLGLGLRDTSSSVSCRYKPAPAALSTPGELLKPSPPAKKVLLEFPFLGFKRILFTRYVTAFQSLLKAQASLIA